MYLYISVSTHTLLFYFTRRVVIYNSSFSRIFSQLSLTAARFSLKARAFIATHRISWKAKCARELRVVFGFSGADPRASQIRLTRAAPCSRASLAYDFWELLPKPSRYKKNIEKSKIIFSGAGIRYRWDVGPFSERP